MGDKRINELSFADSQYVHAHKDELREKLPHPDEIWEYSESDLNFSNLRKWQNYNIIEIAEDKAWDSNKWTTKDCVYEFLHQED